MTATATESPSLPAELPSKRLLTAGFLGRHRVIILLTAAAITIRALLSFAYWPAFWFQTDSGAFIERLYPLEPSGSEANGVGYPAFLRVMEKTGSLAMVAILQHLLALGLAVAVYMVLRRRGLPGWLAALGPVPILFDARQIVLEHYILSDTLFTLLVVAAAVVLLWNERPGVIPCLIAGLAIFGSVLTRSVGIAVFGIFLVYMLIRRLGWRRPVLFAVVFLVPLAGYLAWAKNVTGRATLSSYTERYLYSRTAAIADCGRLKLTEAQRGLCPAQPLGQRPMRGDYYLWSDPNFARYGRDEDPLIGSFANEVIIQQPGDYAALVATDTARFLMPGLSYDAATACLFGWWDFPADLTDTVPNAVRCKPLLANDTAFIPPPQETTTNEHAGLRRVFAWYSDWVTLPLGTLGISVLLTLAALCIRPRRPGWRVSLDAALLSATGLALIVLAVATSMYEVRYGITSTALIGLGGVMAIHRLWCVLRPGTETETQENL